MGYVTVTGILVQNNSLVSICGIWQYFYVLLRNLIQFNISLATERLWTELRNAKMMT